MQEKRLNVLMEEMFDKAVEVIRAQRREIERLTPAVNVLENDFTSIEGENQALRAALNDLAGEYAALYYIHFANNGCAVTDSVVYKKALQVLEGGQSHGHREGHCPTPDSPTRGGCGERSAHCGA